MINKICGAIAITAISLFLIGLAHSIWVNTESVAYPILSAIVLLLAYKSAYDEFFSGPNNI